MTQSFPQQNNDRLIACWLISCALVIFAMIILGGVTRLTHSGLSMVEWKPLLGWIPPLTEQAWLTLFEKYQQFPEYQKVNLGMTLDEFKVIFYFEYWHRVLGRLIGVIFLVPFIIFKVQGKIKPALTPKLVTLFILGALQGLLGWYMVKSGLVDNPQVSQYRLTAHFAAALLIYAYMLWVAFDLLMPASQHRQPMGRYASALLTVVFVMILSGGLVAGTRAGLAYNTWPLMGDTLVPGNIYSLSPTWLSAFEDITTIQFNHRMFAYAVLLLVVMFVGAVLRGDTRPRVRKSVWLLLLVVLVQISLGISTLLLHVPVSLASLHQGGAVCLLTVMLFITYQLNRRHA